MGRDESGGREGEWSGTLETDPFTWDLLFDRGGLTNQQERDGFFNRWYLENCFTV